MKIGHFLAVCLSISPACSYAASIACPPKGAVAEMSDGSKFEFQGADEDDSEVCMWKTIKADGVTQSRFIFAIQNIYSHVIDPDQMRVMLEALFDPASQGVVSAVLNNGEWNSSLKTVMKLTTGSATVPAGIFPTIIVDVDAKGVFGNDNTVSGTYYLDEKTHVPVMIRENVSGHDFVLRAVKITTPRS